jgi:uncharacterized protein YbbK (DUF523 family)
MNILVSACLLGVCCRYDGKAVPDDAVCALIKKHLLIPVCPEQLGGLATPREPAERIGGSVITKSGADVTAAYKKGANEVLKLAKRFDCKCAILKERSPSCGTGRIHDGTFTGALPDGNGVTADLLLQDGIFVISESKIFKCGEKIINGTEDKKTADNIAYNRTDDVSFRWSGQT